MSYQRIPVLVLGAIVFISIGFQLCAQQTGKPIEIPAKIMDFLKAIEPAKGDSELVKKLKERHNVGVLLLEERIKAYKKGIRDISPVFEAARLVVDSKLDLADSDKARVDVLERTLEVARLFENQIQKQLEKGFATKADLERARFARLSVEVDLLKAKQKGANK